jgi:hypothetical protein
LKTVLIAEKDGPKSYSREELLEMRGLLSVLRAAREKEKEAFVRHQNSFQLLQVLLFF